MKKNLFLVFFIAVCITVYSQSANIPYTLQFKGAYGVSVNSGKSYLYVSPSNGNLRADGVLPSPKNADYAHYEWYFLPVEGEEPGWYYVRNGTGKFLYNSGSVIKVGEPSEEDHPKWRFFKVQNYMSGEQEYTFRMVQSVKDKACHMVRSGNTFITTSNSFTTGNTTLSIKPSGEYYLHNNDMELITNHDPCKVSSTISLEPSFFLDSDFSKSMINAYYFPANFKRIASSKATLMYNSTDKNDSYFIRMMQGDAIQSLFSHKAYNEGQPVHYGINVRVRSSQIDLPPVYFRMVNTENGEQMEYPVFVEKANEWYNYQFYISIDNFNAFPHVEIYSSLHKEEAYVDIDNIHIERIETVPDRDYAFLLGEYGLTGEPFFDYPFENPAFTYTVRTFISSEEDQNPVFIPAYFLKDCSSVSITVDKINKEEINPFPIEKVSVDEKGIYFLPEDLLVAGNEYGLSIRVDADGSNYIQHVNVKIVPDIVFWEPEEGSRVFLWNSDNNWKDSTGKQGFIPLRNTNVVLKSGQKTYPLLQSPGIDNDNDPFLKYDYNFLPNVCSDIFFEDGSELGNPYYLQYDGAEIEYEINTMQWYNIAPPLKNMYSGDFMFDQLNPLSELQMHHVVNPQTGFFGAEWTQSFNNTNILLHPGQGYSLRVGSLYYTRLDEKGADFSSESFIDKVKYRFPENKSAFCFYDEVTKIPSDKIEYIPEGGRKFSNRFIYERMEEEECFIPDGDNLFEIDTPVSNGKSPVVIGNPFMSHFDFEAFYFYNSQLIYPEFKLLNSQGEYITVMGIDDDNDGIIEDHISTSESVGLSSIQPMQSFVVTTRDNYSGQAFIINKLMSKVKSEERLSENRNPENTLFIRLEDNSGKFSESILYLSKEKQAVVNRDSRKMIHKYTTDPAYVFIVSNNAFFDINGSGEKDCVEIGVITSQKYNNCLIIDNLSSLESKDEWSFYDAATKTEISFENKEKIIYPFEQINKEAIGRFYFSRNSYSSYGWENEKKIGIFTNKGRVHISSDKSDPIKSVVIYAIDGRKIYEHMDINTSYAEIGPFIQPDSIFIITIRTNKQSKTIKTLF